MLEEAATIMMYKNEMAICEDGRGNLWYTEIPEEYAEIGTAIELRDLDPITNLPLPLQKEIMEDRESMPKELVDELLGPEVIE